MNDTQIIRRQIRRIEFILQSIENKLPAYDKVSKIADDMSLMGINDTLSKIISELDIINQHKMKVICKLSEELKGRETDEDN